MTEQRDGLDRQARNPASLPDGSGRLATAGGSARDDITATPGRLGCLALAEQRIAEIDAMFEGATGWGSWMVMLANEREALANKHGLPHKYLARTASGGRTD